MKRFIAILLAFCIFVPFSIAKDKKISFDTKAAMSYIEELAADAMMGRESGQPSGVMVEDYVAKRFREWGLEPAGNHETYFQNLTLEHSHVAEGVVLEILTERERRDFYYGEDWKVQRLSGSGHFTAELVFVGYGIHAPEKEYDDYIGVDVKGKLVFFTSDTPRQFKGNLKKDIQMQSRIKAAQDHGALGVLLFKQEPSPRQRFRFRIPKEYHKPDFVILSVEDKITNFIFKDLGVDSRYLYREIAKTSKPMSFETGVKAFVSVNAIFDAKRPTRNVIAKISGTDKVLNDECVIIGAHMDHLGINPLGDVMNGANDNASGTAVVLEIARVMKLNRVKPKRTVIFALWAAEEQGLVGSRYYADHPNLPIEKTVAYINMDMVGQGNGKVPFRGVYYGPQIWEALKQKLPKEILDDMKPGRGGPGGSDHTSFLMKGVPGFFIITSPFMKYHHSRDDTDLINPEILKKTGDLVHAAVKILASEDKNFIQPMRREAFYLKYRNLINFNLSPLHPFLEQHKEAKDSDVDMQLTLIAEKEDLSRDELRIDILKSMLTASGKIEKAKGLTFYSDASQLSQDIRLGKTTVLTGLKGIRSFGDDPRWIRVLAKQGIDFVFVDDPSGLFDEEELTEEGKEIVSAANTGGLLLIFEGLNESQSVSILKSSRKPVVLFSKNLPGEEILQQIKKKKSALGLLMGREEESSVYFKKLDLAKKSIGTESFFMVNEQCLWGNEGREQMLKVIAEILNAKYGRLDISNLFSETFLRVLRDAKGEGEPRPFVYIPF